MEPIETNRAPQTQNPRTHSQSRSWGSSPLQPGREGGAEPASMSAREWGTEPAAVRGRSAAPQEAPARAARGSSSSLSGSPFQPGKGLSPLAGTAREPVPAAAAAPGASSSSGGGRHEHQHRAAAAAAVKPLSPEISGTSFSLSRQCRLWKFQPNSTCRAGGRGGAGWGSAGRQAGGVSHT